MPRKNLFDQHCPYVLHVFILKNDTHCSRGHGVRLMAIDSFQRPGVVLIWETSVLAGEALKMDCFILLFEFSLVSPFYCLTYFPYSFLSVWEVARHDYHTVVWAVNPKIKQIVDLRKSDKLTKNYFHYFIIYIDIY